ncbi:hypothetical protein SAMN05192543_11020 [Paraburkholderia megapolitana]|uniref:Galactose mutarotase n=1 Tax=Paraburkholderia megapolitana TaxID=420953 RepID=A0A1I3TNE6_9BURK|nr:hypothetical protein SAMN05192543_11020 [Paraburkholderia megapolitana]
MTVDTWEINWSHGRGTVQALGGMLGPVHFRLPDDRFVQPFALFPWRQEIPPHGHAPLVGLMAHGGGEWPCVPFGEDPCSVKPAWQPPLHGEAAHGVWKRTDDGRDPASLTLQYRCGPAGPIETLYRQIKGNAGEASIECSLIIRARQACRLPVGLHPTLRVPERPGQLVLHPGDFDFAMTYPREVETDADLLAPDRTFLDLSRAPRRNGQAIDLTRYPLAVATESLVQMCGIDGHVSVENLDEHYRVDLDWDAAQLPSCVLWISNGGRASWPWSRRHFALGIEPVCSAFDLGLAASTRPNAISGQGIATAMNLDPSVPTVIRYKMSVAASTC